MSASGAGGPRIRRLFERAANAGDLGTIIFRGFGAVFFAVGTALASGILTFADLFIVPITALFDSVGRLITSVFGGAARIVGVGSVVSAQSLQGQFNVGPFTFPLALGVAMLGFGAVLLYLSQDETGNLFPGLPFDVPTPFVEDPEEDDEGE